MWTASTIKLAMVVDLFTRQRAAEIALTSADRDLIAAMLHSSDDDAADALWTRFGGADHEEHVRDTAGQSAAVPQPLRTHRTRRDWTG